MGGKGESLLLVFSMTLGCWMLNKKIYPTGHKVPFGFQSPEIFLLGFFKDSFLRLFRSVGKVCYINTL